MFNYGIYYLFLGFALSSYIIIYQSLAIRLDEQLKNISILFWLGHLAISFLGSHFLYCLVTSAKLFTIYGHVFYGGLLGSVIWHYIYWNKNKISMLSISCISLTFAHGIGRVGCYFSDCCYGKIIFFKEISVQLVESFYLFSLFIFFYILFKKKFYQLIVLLYFYLYAVFRFYIEGFRLDESRGLWPLFGFTLSTSRIISLIVILFLFLLQLRFLWQKFILKRVTRVKLRF